MKKILAFLSVFLISCMAAQSDRDLSPETFKKLMEDKKNIVIDLRTPGEINSKGKIKGALELDFLAADAEEKIKKLNKKESYLIYCAGGGRSADAMELMIKEGFTNVLHLANGFDNWKRKGFDVEAVK